MQYNIIVCVRSVVLSVHRCRIVAAAVRDSQGDQFFGENRRVVYGKRVTFSNEARTGIGNAF